MKRTWLRLVVSHLSVASFVLANTPAGLAAAALLSQAALGEHQRAAQPAAAQVKQEQSRPPRCAHCAKRGRVCQSEAEEVVPTTVPSRPSQTTERGDGPRDSCPCCPKTPHGPACPCPGGCSLCSVAKVPHLDSAVLSLLPGLSLWELVVDEPILNAASPRSGVERPPRI